MLRSVVDRFLMTVTEREFDGPLMAILGARGFYDIHFTHGSFEFGKDVIAKRDEEGETRQYAIQAKAGDIKLTDWRAIRPQVEEAQKNTLSHPNFDERLPRTAILVTTGRLVGGAALDAQQLAQRSRESGSRFETWEQPQLAEWLSADPSLALTHDDAHLLQIIGAIGQQTIREQQLEDLSRRWLPRPGQAERDRLQIASVEAAVLANRLREAGRLDLAAYTGLHLLRAAWAHPEATPDVRPPLATAAIQLFAGYAADLLAHAKQYLSDKRDLVRSVLDPSSIVTYPVLCCRLNEIFALLALIEEFEPGLLTNATGGEAAAAVLAIIDHPGATRPLSDDFAVSLIAPAIVYARTDRRVCRKYLTTLAKWTLDRYDKDSGNLGLGAHGEPEETLAERLLGAAFEFTQLGRRRTSFLVAVLLDLAAALSYHDLYAALLDNVGAYQIVPMIGVDAGQSYGRRDGEAIRFLPVEYRSLQNRVVLADHHRIKLELPPIDELLVGSSTRSRHYVGVIQALAQFEKAPG